MSIFHMPSGAWLSGLGTVGGQFTPGNPPSGNNPGWTTPNPPTGPGGSPYSTPNPPTGRALGQTADWTTPNPPNSSPRNLLDGRHWRDARTASPWPWEGADAAWTYADSWALLSQALRKSRLKIVQPSDMPDPPAPAGQVQRSGETTRPALWRWQPSYRVQAVVGELMGRVLVHDRTVWLLAPPQAGLPRALAVHPVLDLRVDLTAADYPTQIDKVLRAAVEREDRLPEILAQANALEPFFESVTGISASAAPRTSELMIVAQTWLISLLMSLKNQIAARRPVERSGAVMPVIATPGHGSLPSGHASLAALLSSLWSALLYEEAGAIVNPTRVLELDRLARRIAFNRVVAGVHFPMDSVVGYRLGTQMARCFMALAGAGTGLPPEPLDVDAMQRDPSASPQAEDVELLERGAPPPDTPMREPLQAAQTLTELYARARDELALLRV